MDSRVIAAGNRPGSPPKFHGSLGGPRPTGGRTLHSEAFDALPDLTKKYIFERLREVLDGKDRSEEFAHLSDADRQAIREILEETQADFPRQ